MLKLTANQGQTVGGGGRPTLHEKVRAKHGAALEVSPRGRA